ncbi:hypothetical protein SAMN02745221_01794 [Thermosyntropha lipolytica DSM 11003]|uniref:DUF3828 domain-containing protein n=1 Tax=Thermosyntropha lipolytica DSM 11003 TaxID=1123382 RepID=A0A1M5QLG6_9FIRM|nr:hypothetical protein [Thermosyntropha lipolytica]SHH14934.1 hypothetical protein SAMN02745221_01794 [Thermosyntropha lipolytica DSM 11003]
MRKLLICMLLSFCFLSQNPLYAGEAPNIIFPAGGTSSGDKQNLLVYELIYRYTFYQLFLQESHLEKGFIISNHGENFADLVQYLEQGFSPKLAQQIVSYVTAYQPEIGKQAIIPKEGLPLITKEDLPFIRWDIEEEGIIFTRTYQIDLPDCSSTIDYKIYTRFTQGGLKIYKLELEENKNLY